MDPKVKSSVENKLATTCPQYNLVLDMTHKDSIIICFWSIRN